MVPVSRNSESESELKQRRSIARGKTTKLLKELSVQTDEDDLALAIYHAEGHLSVMVELQCELDKVNVVDDSSHVQELKLIIAA